MLHAHMDHMCQLCELASNGGREIHIATGQYANEDAHQGLLLTMHLSDRRHSDHERVPDVIIT